MLVAKGFTPDVDFFLAFSPERVDPGNPQFNTKNIPIGLVQIGAFDDFKADAAQRFGDEAGIVERGRQRARRITRVADDEGNARFGLLGVLLRLQRRTTQAGSRKQAQREQNNSTKHDSLPFNR